MAHTLDKIFDMPIFSKTHKHYEKSLVYIPDDMYDLWWEGQSGGIEGLNQDTWTITYLGQIKYAFQGLIDSFHLLAKGDDLKAAVPIPVAMLESSESASMASNLKTRVCEAAKKFGHEIKIQESYISENLFTLSKSMFYKRVPLSYCFRKIQKTHGESNIFLPVLDDYVASIFSNAHSSCQSSTITIPQYIVSLFWFGVHLQLHAIYKNPGDLHCLALSLVPSPVGGFPIIYLHNMFVRAESDLLTAFVTLFKYCMNTAHPVWPLLEKFLLIPSFSQAPDFKQLLIDPYSLPLYRPQSAQAFLRKILKRKLLYSSVKREVIDLLAISDSPQCAQLVELFKSCPIWWAKVFSALYDASVFSLGDKLVAQFTSAKSMLDVFLACRTKRGRANKFLRDALMKDKNCNLWRVNILLGAITMANRPFLRDIECPTEMCQKLRDEMWGRPIATVTHPCLTHQIYLSHQDISDSEHERKNHFLLTFKYGEPDKNLPDSIHHTLGPYEPFLGHTTQTGSLLPTLRVSEKDPVCANVLNLAMLYSHTNTSAIQADGTTVYSNVPRLVEKLLTAYTDLNIADLTPFASTKKSGTQTHRMRSRGFRESIVPNNNVVLYTQCQGETNTHTTLRLDPADYTVNFLHILCYSNIVARLDAQASNKSQCLPQIWIVTRDCSYCMKSISEDPIVLDERLLDSLYVTRLSISEIGKPAERILREALTEFQTKFPTVRTIEHNYDDLPYSCEMIAKHWVQTVWCEGHQATTRYGFHRDTPRTTQIAQHLLGSSTTRSIGQTEAHLLPPQVVIEQMSLWTYHELAIKYHCYKAEDIPSMFSTGHLEVLSCYSMFWKLQGYGLLATYLTQLSDHFETVLPARALVDLEVCVKFSLPLLFQHGSYLIDEALVFPVYNEYTVESHAPYFNLLSDVSDLIALRRILSRDIEEYEEQLLVLYDYLYVVAPTCPVDQSSVFSGSDDVLSLKDVEALDIETNYDAILNPQHRKYTMINNILGNRYREVLSLLESIPMDNIQEALGEVPNSTLPVMIAHVSLSQCVDHLRSTRVRGSSLVDMDEMEIPSMEEGIANLTPMVVLHQDRCHIVPPTVVLNPAGVPLNFHDGAPTVQYRANYNYMSTVIGGLDEDLAVYGHLFIEINLTPSKLRSLRHIIITNDRGFTVLKLITNINCPNKLSHGS